MAQEPADLNNKIASLALKSQNSTGNGSGVQSTILSSSNQITS